MKKMETKVDILLLFIFAWMPWLITGIIITMTPIVVIGIFLGGVVYARCTMAVIIVGGCCFLVHAWEKSSWSRKFSYDFFVWDYGNSCMNSNRKFTKFKSNSTMNFNNQFYIRYKCPNSCKFITKRSNFMKIIRNCTSVFGYTGKLKILVWGFFA